MVVGVALILMEVASLMEIATRINPKLSDNPLFQILDNAHIIEAARESAMESEAEEAADAMAGKERDHD